MGAPYNEPFHCPPYKIYLQPAKNVQNGLVQAVSARASKQPHKYVVLTKDRNDMASLTSDKSKKSSLLEIAEVSKSTLENLKNFTTSAKKNKSEEKNTELKEIKLISESIFEAISTLIEAKETKNKDLIQKFMRGMSYFFTAITIVGLPATWYLLKKQNEREQEISKLKEMQSNLGNLNQEIQSINKEEETEDKHLELLDETLNDKIQKAWASRVKNLESTLEQINRYLQDVGMNILNESEGKKHLLNELKAEYEQCKTELISVQKTFIESGEHEKFKQSFEKIEQFIDKVNNHTTLLPHSKLADQDFSYR